MALTRIACLLILVILSSSTFAEGEPPHRFQEVNFYISAHQDDWELFMGPNAHGDVRNPDSKTVFIYTTAGDAGLGKGGGNPDPYYLARENGANLSVQFIADAGQSPVRPQVSTAVVGDHSIRRVAYQNTVSYFLRLPDGSMGGEGFPNTGHQSLTKLRDGKIASIDAVDGSATYVGWLDLVATLRLLLEQERGDADRLRVNFAETRSDLNLGDHSDHIATAHAVLGAISGHHGIDVAQYIDYASARMPPNLSSEQAQVEAAVYAVMVSGVTSMGYASAWDRWHRSFLGRVYARLTPRHLPLKEGAYGCLEVIGRLPTI